VAGTDAMKTKQIIFSAVFFLTLIAASSGQLFSGNLASRQNANFTGNFNPMGKYRPFDVAIFSNSVAMICTEGGVGSRAKFVPFYGESKERVAKVFVGNLTVEMIGEGMKSSYLVKESDFSITNGVLKMYSNSDREIVLSNFVIQFVQQTEE
jgi:hypothetical protein